MLNLLFGSAIFAFSGLITATIVAIVETPFALLKIPFICNTEVMPNIFRHPRDSVYFIPFFFLITYCSLLMFIFSNLEINVYTFLAYHCLRAGPRFTFLMHAHTLFHREGHSKNGFFNDNLWFFNYWPMQYFIGIFYGQIPGSYRYSHNKIHHGAHGTNMDIPQNKKNNRLLFSSYISFISEFFFFWTGITPLIRFLSEKKYKFALGIFSGMAYHYSVIVLVFFYYGPLFGLSFFVYPIFESTIAIGSVAYLWHIFEDGSDNPLIKSLIILNGNRNIWNEDFHTMHHENPTVHWSDTHKYLELTGEYLEKGAIVFADTEVYELLFWILTKNFDKLDNCLIYNCKYINRIEYLKMLLSKTT